MVRIKLSFWRFLCFERKKLLWRHGHMTLWELEKRCQTIWDTSDHAELQSAKETKNTQIVRWWDHMSCLNTMYVPKRLIFVTLFNNQPCIIKALFSYWMNVYVSSLWKGTLLMAILSKPSSNWLLGETQIIDFCSFMHENHLSQTTVLELSTPKYLKTPAYL